MTRAAVRRRTHVIDAADRPIGRVASEIVRLLRGKHKVNYAPHRDDGDCVVVRNVQRAAFTGKKLDQKTYFHFSGYPGGIRRDSLKDLWAKDPAAVFRRVVTQMLPATTLRKRWLKRLRIEGS
jgi:large subunit ribosomal protein L13